MRRIGLFVLVLLLLVGCGRPEPQPSIPSVEKAATPAPEQSVVTSDPPPASRVFPLEDGVYRFVLREGYEGSQSEIEEEWVREDGRLVATQGGRPYVSWLWRPDGIWRADPKNPKVLLRYLPQDLVEGSWRQRSGDAWVYFRLREESFPNFAWVLTVLNRGDRTEWRFGSGQHVSAEDPARPAAAFTKYGGGKEGAVTAERRAAILAAAPFPTGEPATVEAITSSQFVDGLIAIGYERQQLDLNADGQPDPLVGLFSRTTWFGPELLDPAEQVLLRPGGYGEEGLHMIAALGGQPRFLIQRHEVLELLWVEFRDGHWQAAFAWDLAPKSYVTPATRTKVLPDGRIQVEWEPVNDPGKHRRVRHFTMTEADKVTWLDDMWEVAGGALRRPESPLDLLQGFIFAQAYGLQEEARSYLARPEMASRFPLPDQPKPRYTEPAVRVGQVDQATCLFKKGEMPTSGPIPFYAIYGEYEGVTLQHGTAVVGRAPDGRLVIESIEFGKRCFSGL